MKVIFLDIDGVLNHSALNHTRELFDEINDIKYDAMHMLSSKCISRLNDITDETGAKLVISSTWRKYEDVDDMLIKAGVTGEIIGHTPVLNFLGAYRGNEIQVWINSNIKKDDDFNYVILDDDSDMLYWQRNHMIIVDRECGLSQDAAYKAIRILKGIF